MIEVPYDIVQNSEDAQIQKQPHVSTNIGYQNISIVDEVLLFHLIISWKDLWLYHFTLKIAYAYLMRI